ncbi:unnamed protein product [Amaranthus hypochondriacus]
MLGVTSSMRCDIVSSDLRFVWIKGIRRVWKEDEKEREAYGFFHLLPFPFSNPVSPISLNPSKALSFFVLELDAAVMRFIDILMKAVNA